MDMDRLTWKKMRFGLYHVKSEQELEDIVSNRYTEVFWPDWPDAQVLYFNIKKRITSIAKEICIPDGLLLWLDKSIDCSRLHIVEYELASHKDEHILNQIRRFKNAIDNVNSRKILIDAIIDEIDENETYQRAWKGQLPKIPYYRGCSEILPEDIGVIVVVDDMNDRLKNLAKDIMSYNWVGENINLFEVKFYAPINNPPRSRVRPGKEVMALYPDPDDFDWYRATISSVINKGKKYKVKWYDGDNSNRMVSRISPIGDLLIRTRWVEDLS